VAIGGTTANAIGENENGAAAIAAGDALVNRDGTLVNIPDATVQALGRNMADDAAIVEDNSINATGILGAATNAGNANNASLGGQAAYSEAGDANNQLIGLGAAGVIGDSGMAQTQGAGFQNGTGTQANTFNVPVAVNGAASNTGPALNNSNTNALASGGVAVSDPENNAVNVGAGNSAWATGSAVAQGSTAVNGSPGANATDTGDAIKADGGQAIKTTGDSNNIYTNPTGNFSSANTGPTAQANNAPVAQDSSQAFTNNAAAAIAQTGSAAFNAANGSMANTGNAYTANDQAAMGDNAAKVISNPQATANIDSPYVEATGQLAVGTSNDANNTTQSPVGGANDSVQTLALTELKQVNAGVYAGNGSGNTSGTMNVNTANSATTGLQVLSYNMGGVATNVASQNVINVTNNAMNTP
jgi:hypothetical protein